MVFDTAEDENKTVSKWLSDRMNEGMMPHEMGVFVRSEEQLNRARTAVKVARIPFKILDEKVETTSGHVSISTMHLAKGPEFCAVVVMSCDDEVIPLQERIETVSDDADLEEVYEIWGWSKTGMNGAEMQSSLMPYSIVWATMRMESSC